MNNTILPQTKANMKQSELTKSINDTYYQTIYKAQQVLRAIQFHSLGFDQWIEDNMEMVFRGELLDWQFEVDAYIRNLEGITTELHRLFWLKREQFAELHHKYARDYLDSVE